MRDLGIKESLQSFVDSPLTWGGLGAVFGFCLSSPHTFKQAYIGAGIAIGIGFLRAMYKLKSHIAMAVALLLLAGMMDGWYKAWKIVPKPTEPVDANDVANIVTARLLNTDFGKTPSNTAVPVNAKQVSADHIADVVFRRIQESVDISTASNAELKIQAKIVSEELEQRISTTWNKMYAFESKGDRPQSQALAKAFVADPSNQALMTKANDLRTILLARLGRQATSPLFPGGWPGSGGIAQANVLVGLAGELPQ